MVVPLSRTETACRLLIRCVDRYGLHMSYTRRAAPGRHTSLMQDAVRLLLVLNTASEPLPAPAPLDAPANTVAVLHTQVLLQKLDFWVRNPDYLADELLTRYENDGNTADLALAKQILESDEPEVRSYPMLRYLFGAYEPLDEALAVLATPGLVFARRRGSHTRVTHWDYYVTKAGRDTAERSISAVPELKYYVDRTRLVVDLAAGHRGTALKDIQYLQAEYADATLGRYIASIASRARQRLQEISDRAAKGSAHR
jgi:hypothetical protein